MTSQFLERRLQDLASHVTQDQTLLQDFEDALRYESDPRTKARYRRDIEQLRESARRYRQEYDEILIQMAGQQQSAQLQTVSSQLQQMDHKLDRILDSQTDIYESLTETQQALLSRYAATEQVLLEGVVQQLDQYQLAFTQTLVDALDRHQLSEPEMQQMWAVLEERLPELPPSQAAIAEIVKEPGLDAKHKLKVTLPIVPFLVDYEGELELGAGFNLKSAWERLITKLRNRSTHSANSHQSPAKQPIWDFAQELIQDMTEAEINRLPRDGAEQHDHYIYGTPKREQ